MIFPRYRAKLMKAGWTGMAVADNGVSNQSYTTHSGPLLGMTPTHPAPPPPGADITDWDYSSPAGSGLSTNGTPVYTPFWTFP